jgi:hypothetical protein
MTSARFFLGVGTLGYTFMLVAFPQHTGDQITPSTHQKQKS